MGIIKNKVPVLSHIPYNEWMPPEAKRKNRIYLRVRKQRPEDDLSKDRFLEPGLTRVMGTIEYHRQEECGLETDEATLREEARTILCRPGYVTAMCRPMLGDETGEVTQVIAGSLNFCEVRENDDDPEPFARRKLEDLKDHAYLYQFEEVNGEEIFVIRKYYFHPLHFHYGEPEAYKEVSRICFTKTEVWEEKEDGTCWTFPYECFLWHTGTIHTYYKPFDNIKDAEEALLLRMKLERMFNLRGEMSAHMEDTNIFEIGTFLHAYFHAVRNRGIYGYVPEGIRKHLTEGECIRATEIKLADPKGDSFIRLSKMTGTDSKPYCYISMFRKREIGVTDEIERIYFDDSRYYSFVYNFMTNEWASTKRTMDIWYMRLSPAVSVFKTNTVLDRFRSIITEEPATGLILRCIKYPFAEQLIKMPCGNKKPWSNAEDLDLFSFRSGLSTEQKFRSYVARTFAVNTKELGNMSVEDLTGIPAHLVAYALKMANAENGKESSVSLYELSEIADIYNDDEIKAAIPDNRRRVETATLCRNQHNMLMHIDVEDKIAVWRYIDRGVHKDARKLLTFYPDYLRMREGANLYNARLRELGRDSFYYPERPKFSGLEFMHNKAHRDNRMFNSLCDEETVKLTDRKISKQVSKERYTKFLYENDRYLLKPVTDSESLAYEGATLHHCVGSYAGRVADGSSRIYFLRRKTEPDTPFFTLELIKQNGKDVLNQCYTMHDTTEKPKSCAEFLRSWAEGKGIKINCTI